MRVLPAMPSGRITASVAVSPGHGRHSGSFALASALTMGMPAKSACQIGLMSSRQSSIQDAVLGAVRTNGER